MKIVEFNGKKYKELNEFQLIKKGDLHSWTIFTLREIPFDYIGMIPDDFLPERKFWRLVEDMS